MSSPNFCAKSTVEPASHQIRDALSEVAALRQRAAASAALAAALSQVKTFQSKRFVADYGDLLASPLFGPSARFFLQELYSERDYSERDAQFFKVAGVIEASFPQRVLEITTLLARLHLTTETLDLRMAQCWESPLPLPLDEKYRRAWADIDQGAARQWQLDTVLGIGRELHGLTRKPGLRILLKAMRGPAKVAGLSTLQGFLEAGFDCFAELARAPHAVETFLETIARREQRWLDQLNGSVGGQRDSDDARLIKKLC